MSDTAPVVGSVCTFVDRSGTARPALVTAVNTSPLDAKKPGGASETRLNLTWIDPETSGPYGARVTTETSVPPESNTEAAKHGHWRAAGRPAPNERHAEAEEKEAVRPSEEEAEASRRRGRSR